MNNSIFTLNSLKNVLPQLIINKIGITVFFDHKSREKYDLIEFSKDDEIIIDSVDEFNGMLDINFHQTFNIDECDKETFNYETIIESNIIKEEVLNSKINNYEI